ncbi:TetR/AcrR family transcriptional regulator [Georgenia sp. AZ-5]|uniref:TetR/AcrR family transcriptional regulator n=1 Tax=Georgenia sp. AZ-5 TaxID=3367526 RepID=UPI0037545C2F
MTRLREAQKQMTRRLLLEKGLELFETKGYAATTIDDIAVSAGTTRTTFYMHFPSKAHLMRELVTEVNEIITSTDDPPLTTVVQSGDRAGIRAWLSRKMDQWPTILPYVHAGEQAAGVDPEVRDAVDGWFDATIEDMAIGLDRADRFEPSTRRTRCALAFGQLQFLSLRWKRLGWDADRETALGLLVDGWCSLLTE